MEPNKELNCFNCVHLNTLNDSKKYYVCNKKNISFNGVFDAYCGKFKKKMTIEEWEELYLDKPIKEWVLPEEISFITYENGIVISTWEKLRKNYTVWKKGE